jgi:CubicO group peptidase (beta-lactamase class C family)
MRVLPAVVSALWLPAALLAQPPAGARQQVDALFARYNRTDSPGCTVAAAQHGATILSAAYGMADLEHGIALEPDSVLEAGSVSKQFTAGAVLLLAQQGKLSLDDPVRKYLPELPDHAAGVTIRQMLHHTSGLRDWGSVAAIGGWPRTSRAYTHAHVLEIVARQKALNYAPGALYSYSNTGYNLAAILVSRVAGKPFAEFTREAIFRPLGMQATEWRDDFRRIVPRRAVAYQGGPGSFLQDMPFEDVHGNGGLLTTVGDLLRWNHNFTSLTIGGRDFVEEQQRQGKLSDGKTIAYAAGLRVASWRGVREVSHSGATAGYRAWLARYPDQSLSVAVLCNLTAGAAPQLGRQVAQLYLGSALPPPAALQPAPVDAATLAARAGLYRSTRDHTTLRVTLEGGVLRLGRTLLTPKSATVFATGSDSDDIEFSADGARLVSGNAGDGREIYERVEPANPSAAELADYAGEYVSDEAETGFRVSADNGRLVAWQRPDTKIALAPTYRDAFSSSLGSVRFLRDAAGRVSEMSIGQSRVWDLRFRKVR